MRRITVLVLAMSVAILAMAASVAFAAEGPTSGVHFTKNGKPTCTIFNSGTSAYTDCTSELAGLGEGNVTLSASLTGAAVYQCQNQGGNIAPGQNKVLVGPSGTTKEIPGGSIKNGRAKLPISTKEDPLTAPETVTGAEAGCPNDNWTGVNPELSVTSITYSAVQGGVTVFSCTREGANLTGTIKFTDAECSGVARF